MATIISGHGDRIDGEEKTFVPPGTSVSFYGDADKLLPQSIELAAVASGAIGSPNEKFGAGEEIWNYHIYANEDLVTARIMQLDPGSNTLVFVGPDVPDDTTLCTSVEACAQAGSHSCQGILGRYSGDLVVLACRGVEGEDSENSEQFGSDEDDPLYDLDQDLDAWVDAFSERAKADPDAAEAEFDALPEGTKLLLMSASYPLQGWAQARWVRQYAERRDFAGFVGQINGSSVPKSSVQPWFADIPAYADSLFFLVVERMRSDLKDTIDGLPSDPTAARAEVEDMVSRWEQEAPDDLATIESLLGFEVDKGRLTSYGQFQQFETELKQKLQELEQQFASQDEGEDEET